MNRTRKTVPGGFYIRAEAGDVNLQAATADDGKTLRRFTMTAYTGGQMALAGWPYPVVVDLTGLVLGKKSRPILMNHDTARIVGHTDTVGVEGTALTVAGVISGVGSAAREVVGASDNGFPWQASLGAAVKKVVFVPEGKTAAANGKEFAGPVYMVRQAKLGEDYCCARSPSRSLSTIRSRRLFGASTFTSGIQDRTQRTSSLRPVVSIRISTQPSARVRNSCVGCHCRSVM